MSALDCASILDNWTGWLPNDGVASAASCSTTGDESLVGSDKIQQIMNYFVGQGLTAPQAAGITGNLQSESAGTFDPSIVEGGGKSDTIPATGGYGLAQWTSAGRKQNLQDFATQEGLPVNSMKLQLDFIWHELTTSYKDSTLTPLKASTTVDDASNIILAHYETSQDYLDNGLNGRDGNARRHNSEVILASYGASTGSTDTSSDTAVSTTTGCGSGSNGSTTATAGSDMLGDPGQAAVVATMGIHSPGDAQCTDYVAYELAHHYKPFMNSSHGLPDGIDVVPTLASRFHVKVDSTPAVHAVFSQHSPSGNVHGHTGIVSGVTLNSDGSLKSFTIEEYNFNNENHYGTRTVDASYIAQYSMTFAHTETDWQ